MSLKEEYTPEEIHRLNFEEIGSLLREQKLSFSDLKALRFNPYFPLGNNNIEQFNEFSRRGYEDMQLILASLDKSGPLEGLKATSITGSAAVGLANYFQFSYNKERYPFGYLLTRKKGGRSDIDIEILASKAEMEELANFFRKNCLELRKSNKLSTPPGQLNFAFYPIEHIYHSLYYDPYSSCLVRFGVWSNARVVLFGEDQITDLREIAQVNVKNNPEIKSFFWNNLADRYLFHQYRLLIKRGERSFIFVSGEKLPTLFDERIRSSKMTDLKITFTI